MMRSSQRCALDIGVGVVPVPGKGRQIMRARSRSSLQPEARFIKVDSLKAVLPKIKRM